MKATAIAGCLSVLLLASASSGCGRVWYDPRLSESAPPPIDSGPRCDDAACPDAASFDGGSSLTLTDVCGFDALLPARGDPATTAYVDAVAGSDHPTNCTDPGSPCRTIPYAVANYVAGQDGDRVLIRGSQAHAIPSELRLDDTRSGTAGNPTVFEAWPGTGRPVLDGGGTAPTIVSSCCGASAARYLWIEGLTFTGATDVGLQFSGSGSVGNVVTNCRFVGNGQGPSSAGAPNGGLALVDDTATTFVVGNVIEENQDDGSDFANGITVDGTDHVIANNSVLSNEVYGIEVFGDGHRIMNNQVVSNRDCGVRIRSASRTLVCNNIIRNNLGTALGIQDGSGVRLYHNTLVDNDESSIEIEGTTASELRSNILMSSGAFGIDVMAGADEPADSHNLYFGNPSGPTSGMTRDMSDSDIVGSDPRFVSPGTFDFQLQADSPARSTGHDGFDIGSLRIP